MDAVPEQPAEADKYWVDDRQRTAEVKLWMEARQGEQTDRYWTESRHQDRHLDRQWTVDRHTQRQIDRKIEKQWLGGRQIERSWSENKAADFPADGQRSWRTERQLPPLQLAQRPLLTFPSDGTPSPKQEDDQPRNAESTAALTWHQQETQDLSPDAAAGFTEGWRSGGAGGGGGGSRGVAAVEPPQHGGNKPNLPRLRPRHRNESSDSHPGGLLARGLR